MPMDIGLELAIRLNTPVDYFDVICPFMIKHRCRLEVSESGDLITITLMHKAYDRTAALHKSGFEMRYGMHLPDEIKGTIVMTPTEKHIYDSLLELDEIRDNIRFSGWYVTVR